MELSEHAVGVVFWVVIGVIVVGRFTLKFLRHRETQKTLRLAIEKGDEAAIAQVVHSAHASEKKPPRAEGLLLGGGIQMAVGLGLVLLSLVVNQPAPMILYPLLAIGVMVFMIGAVVFGFGRWQLRRQAAERTPV